MLAGVSPNAILIILATLIILVIGGRPAAIRRQTGEFIMHGKRAQCGIVK